MISQNSETIMFQNSQSPQKLEDPLNLMNLQNSENIQNWQNPNPQESNSTAKKNERGQMFGTSLEKMMLIRVEFIASFAQSVSLEEIRVYQRYLVLVSGIRTWYLVLGIRYLVKSRYRYPAEKPGIWYLVSNTWSSPSIGTW